MISFRRLDLLGCLLAAGLLAAAGWLQVYAGLRPCPLCILERWMIGLLGSLHFAGIVWRLSPRDRLRLNVGKLAAALLGAALTVRQLWLAHRGSSTCQADIARLGDAADVPGFQRLIQSIFSGSGECGSLAGSSQFLHLDLAVWTLLGFGAFLVLALWQRRTV